MFKYTSLYALHMRIFSFEKITLLLRVIIYVFSGFILALLQYSVSFLVPYRVIFIDSIWGAILSWILFFSFDLSIRIINALKISEFEGWFISVIMISTIINSVVIYYFVRLYRKLIFSLKNQKPSKSRSVGLFGHGILIAVFLFIIWIIANFLVAIFIPEFVIVSFFLMPLIIPILYYIYRKWRDSQESRIIKNQ